ncbi:3-isopropylmalate dehydrogenase [Leekyejoonella antrihumi]|uniref:3-isopropylmalate dehydrogenase n=1 Tax=Leekyejoonella antrihumi TaxID=1660198 RepID=A0A563E0U7_9MICO|nr:3-isopropylmalate dehydrogenase [Leekyejoonella antrihumi]TWP35792.1 3-isopropylmalate dehydrogenase [Leekyejoonella antrihumi]
MSDRQEIDIVSKTVAVIPGDGIGPEVIAEALKVLDALGERFELNLDVLEVPLGANHYLSTGELLPESMLAQLDSTTAILLGALGDPRVTPGLLERGVIVKLRQRFRQSVNVRPIRLLPGAISPIVGLTPEDCDFVIVRENTEGLYTGGSSTTAEGTSHAVAVHTSVTTSAGTRACVEYAFGLAQRRRKQLTLCHKTNILIDAGRLWLDTFNAVAAGYPEVTTEYQHADAMCLHLVNRPRDFDVIVTDNLFGDILSDLGAAIQGGLGTAPSANLNLDNTAPSLFEPIHGSAPDIAGQGIANPAGAILSMAMLLDELGHGRAAAHTSRAVEAALLELTNRQTAFTTVEFGTRVVELLSV